MNARAPHPAHDFTALVARWKRLARRVGRPLVEVARVSRQPVYALRTATETEAPGVYASAGIHGDEPAAAWGLLAWAEAEGERLREENWMIFPCLNPWGFLRNDRHDAQGRDLNRVFHEAKHPLVASWRRFVGASRFRLSVTLHEDFDARGIYVYQLGNGSRSLAQRALAAAARVIPCDTRTFIDGHAAKRGVIRPVRKPRFLIGEPEARRLWRRHAEGIVNLETPSEFAFEDRVRAHREFLACVVAQLRKASKRVPGSVEAVLPSARGAA
ncbi:MAG: succinylglutamate desuccinylase/aspartoacylase family protein [Verrucomicrobiae bacterium]|nr:succinylglutamate desuccinylase/aspartoacylase family protein [Verrucomicrobiae bacterium]